MTARLKTAHLLISLLMVVALAVASTATAPVSLAAGATLSLDPATVTANTDQTFQVKVMLNTGGNTTDGARIVLLYDKDVINATKITPGTIYKEYPSSAQTIDNATGTVKVSGIADTQSTFNGTGTFATIDFVAKKAGSAAIKFDFTQGSTTDSNVADTATSTDILSGVSSASVTVSGSTSPTTTPRATDSANRLPNTANITPTVLLAGMGAALVLLGLGVFATGRTRSY